MGRGGTSLRRRVAILAFLALGTTGAAAGPAPPAVDVAAIPEVASITPGGTFQVAVRLRVPGCCHISWTNPGQSGLPTTLAWRVPRGVRAEGTQWPYPERDETEGYVSHVYRGTVVLVTRFRVDSSASGSTVVLRGRLSWGICGKTCLPQRDSVEVTLPVAARPQRPTAAWHALAKSLERLPAPGAGLTLSAEPLGAGVRLEIAGRSLGVRPGTRATFFPTPEGDAEVVAVERAGRGVAVRLAGGVLAGHPGRLEGVLVAERPWSAGSPRKALEVDAVVR